MGKCRLDDISKSVNREMTVREKTQLLDILSLTETYMDTLANYISPSGQASDVYDPPAKEDIEYQAHFAASASLACETVLDLKRHVDISEVVHLDPTRYSIGGQTIADLSSSTVGRYKSTRTPEAVNDACTKYKLEPRVDTQTGRGCRDARIINDDIEIVSELVKRRDEYMYRVGLRSKSDALSKSKKEKEKMKVTKQD